MKTILQILKESYKTITEGKHWPEDYVKTAFNTIKNSELGKQSWYTDNYIKQDLKTIVDEFEPLSHKNSNLGYFATIIKWLTQYAGDNKQKYQEFIERKLDTIVRTLLWLSNNQSEEAKLKDEIKQKWTFEDFEKYAKKLDKSISKSQSDKLKNVSTENKDYEVIRIDSYEEMFEKFGGDKTGYKGESEWCHTNGKSTYESWTDMGKYNFFVLARKDWEKIEPPDPKTTNAYDEYGTSLIAILVQVKNKKLKNATLRWNHIISPSDTISGRSVDTAFSGWGDLAEVVGKNTVSKIQSEIGELQKRPQKADEEKTAEANAQVKEMFEYSSGKEWYVSKAQKKYISEVHIPDVPGPMHDQIEEYMFEKCPRLEKVTMDDSIEVIGIDAFAWCPKLKTIELSKNLEVIGGHAFSGTAIEQITIPRSVRLLGAWIFNKCRSLHSIKLYDNIDLSEDAIEEYSDYGFITSNYISESNDLFGLDNDSVPNLKEITIFQKRRNSKNAERIKAMLEKSLANVGKSTKDVEIEIIST